MLLDIGRQDLENLVWMQPTNLAPFKRVSNKFWNSTRLIAKKQCYNIEEKKLYQTQTFLLFMIILISSTGNLFNLLNLCLKKLDLKFTLQLI